MVSEKQQKKSTPKSRCGWKNCHFKSCFALLNSILYDNLVIFWLNLLSVENPVFEFDCEWFVVWPVFLKV